jgi:hypothetical protein
MGLGAGGHVGVWLLLTGQCSAQAVLGWLVRAGNAVLLGPFVWWWCLAWAVWQGTVAWVVMHTSALGVVCESDV